MVKAKCIRKLDEGENLEVSFSIIDLKDKNGNEISFRNFEIFSANKTEFSKYETGKVYDLEIIDPGIPTHEPVEDERGITSGVDFMNLADTVGHVIAAELGIDELLSDVPRKVVNRIIEAGYKIVKK
jgi:hypothetical protein